MVHIRAFSVKLFLLLAMNRPKRQRGGHGARPVYGAALGPPSTGCRRFVAIGTIYRGNWHEIPWHLARYIVTAATKDGQAARDSPKAVVAVWSLADGRAVVKAHSPTCVLCRRLVGTAVAAQGKRGWLGGQDGEGLAAGRSGGGWRRWGRGEERREGTSKNSKAGFLSSRKETRSWSSTV